MKKFNLDAALKGEPVCTRGGLNVIDTHFLKSVDRIVGVCDNTISYWNLDGSYYTDYEHHFDLFMAEKPKVKKEGWVTLVKCNDGGVSSIGVYNTQEYAIRDNRSENIVATIKIEWEEEEP